MATPTTRGTNGWRIMGWSIAALLLLVPLAAMRFTDEVRWTASDFVFAGVMIGGVGLALELIVRRSRRLAYRVGAGVALLAAFLLVWINAAVGIIGDESDPRNLAYAGVLLVAAAGVAVARFRAAGSAKAMAVAAAAQAIAGIYAVASGGSEPPGPLGLAVLNGGFVALFAVAALFFAHAARGEAVDSASV